MTHRLPPFTRTLALALALALGSTLAPVAVQPAAQAAEASAKRVKDAQRKLRQQDLTGALKDLEAALNADPNDPDANLLYQDTASEVLGIADVEARYTELAAANPDDPLFQFLAARLLETEASASAFEKLKGKFKDSPWPHVGKARALEGLDRVDTALNELDAAIGKAPEADKPRFRTYRAAALERAKRWATAVSSWRSVVVSRPEDGSAHIGLGEALRGSGAPDEAIEAFDAAAKHMPGDPEPHYRKGIALLDQGNWDESVVALEQALKLDKEMVEAMCAASEALLAKATENIQDLRKPYDEKVLSKADKYASKAITVNPDSARAHFALGAVLEVAGEADIEKMRTAIEEYSAVLAIYTFPGPERVRGLVARAYVNLRMARFPDALEDAENALDIDANHATATLHAAHALVGSELYEDAIKKYFKPGAKKWKTDPRFPHGMGMAYWSLGKIKDAEKGLKAAAKIEPDNGIYRLAYGEYLYEQRKNKDAVKELFEATELRPWDAAAWRAFGRACTSQKHWEDAVEAFEKAIELDAESIEEHLYCAIILADQMKKPEDAKPHIETFREKGGSDPNLEDWMDRVLEGK